MYFDNQKKRDDKLAKLEADHEKMVNASGIKFAWWPVRIGHFDTAWLENVRWQNARTGYEPGHGRYRSYITYYERLEK